MKTYLLSLSQMLKDNPLVEDIPLWIGGLLLIWAVVSLFDMYLLKKRKIKAREKEKNE